jgi:hypothetical protein
MAILSQFVHRMQQILDENASKDEDGESSGKLARKDAKELQVGHVVGRMTWSQSYDF